MQTTDSSNACIPPYVTVIVAAYNEELYLGDCLDALVKQDYPSHRYEIIVANGNSTDATRSIAARYEKMAPAVRIIDNPRRLTAAGLNAALCAARGEIIVRMDAHTVAATDYISRCVELLMQNIADNVGGAMRPRGSSLTGKAVAAALCSSFGTGGAAFRRKTASGYVDTVYLGAFRRSLFQRIGMFDETVGPNEDDEFNFRLRRSGGRVYLSPAILSFYHPRESLPRLWQQYFGYGFWKARLILKHRAIPSPRCLMPPIFVAGLMVSTVFSLWYVWAARLCAAFAASYLSANATASIVAAAQHGWRLFPLLPLVYAIMHIAYGTGMLAGAARFLTYSLYKQLSAHIDIHRFL